MSLDIEQHINSFIDWSFSQGRPEFADEFGTEEHTQFCLEFIKRVTSQNGYYGLTGPIAGFFRDLATVSDLDGHQDIRLLMAYYVYMNTLRDKDWDTFMEIKIDSERINKIMVLA